MNSTSLERNEVRSEKGEWWKLLRSSSISAGVLAVLFGITSLFTYKVGNLEVAKPTAFLFAIASIWVIRSFYRWTKADTCPMTVENRTSFEKRWEGIQGGDWLMRYTVAAVTLLVAIYFEDVREGNEITKWVPLIAAVIAAGWAWELTIILLAIALFALAVQWIASLSVGAAIIVGACIIAFAIYKGLKRR